MCDLGAGGTFVGRMEWLRYPGMGFGEFAGFLGLLAYLYIPTRVLIFAREHGFCHCLSNSIEREYAGM